MSHYEFLKGYLSEVCYLHSPVHYDDGHFSVLVEDSEGYHGVDIIFDKNGNMIKE
jgi:hypothetical protein